MIDKPVATPKQIIVDKNQQSIEKVRKSEHVEINKYSYLSPDKNFKNHDRIPSSHNGHRISEYTEATITQTQPKIYGSTFKSNFKGHSGNKTTAKKKHTFSYKDQFNSSTKGSGAKFLGNSNQKQFIYNESIEAILHQDRSMAKRRDTELNNREPIEAVPFIIDGENQNTFKNVNPDIKLKKQVQLKLHSDAKDPKIFSIKKRNSKKNVIEFLSNANQSHINVDGKRSSYVGTSHLEQYQANMVAGKNDSHNLTQLPPSREMEMSPF